MDTDLNPRSAACMRPKAVTGRCSLRILYVGEFATPQYDQAMANALAAAGCAVERLAVYPYVQGEGLWPKLQHHFLWGPRFRRLYHDLLATAVRFRPDAVYFRRPVEFPSPVLRRLRQHTAAVLAEYMNDDPFGPDRHRHWFRHYRRTIPLFDVHFAFREPNAAELRAAGAPRVELLWPYYVAALHYPRELREVDRAAFACDAVFVGHGEAGFRNGCFDALLEAGISLRLYGSGFEPHAAGRPHARLLPTRYLGPDEYATALQAAHCALCFFSERNRDLLTTRVFEILACGAVLVAQRNPLMKALLSDGQEAFLFDSPAELVEIVRALKGNPDLQKRVAQAGRRWVLTNHHEVSDRAAAVLEVLAQLCGRSGAGGSASTER
jgi:spore maturation protein CgeB